jgi:hypothetical protein
MFRNKPKRRGTYQECLDKLCPPIHTQTKIES